jgi:hypothetical protein
MQTYCSLSSGTADTKTHWEHECSSIVSVVLIASSVINRSFTQRSSYRECMSNCVWFIKLNNDAAQAWFRLSGQRKKVYSQHTFKVHTETNVPVPSSLQYGLCIVTEGGILFHIRIHSINTVRMNGVDRKWRTGRIIQPKDNWSTWRKTYPSVILSKINPTWTGMSSNSGLHCNRPQTYCLRHSLQSIASNKYIRQKSHTNTLHWHNNGAGIHEIQYGISI